MIVEVKRVLSNPNETLGVMSIDGTPVCFTLEDEYREKKIMSETRIPAGEYEIKLRTVGGHHERYSKLFPAVHKGMLELQDVPNFQFILIHIGNTDKDTAGCILVGEKAVIGPKLRVENSTIAYTKIYPIILSALDRNESVKIIIRDMDK